MTTPFPYEAKQLAPLIFAIDAKPDDTIVSVRFDVTDYSEETDSGFTAPATKRFSITHDTFRKLVAIITEDAGK